MGAPTSFLLFGQVLDLGVGRIVLNRLDAVQRAFLAFVMLAGGDDLSIGRVQTEMEFARAALSNSTKSEQRHADR
jgi:hypothetical protein